MRVAVGRFGSPYGVKGWVKVFSYTDPVSKILEYQPWSILKNDIQIVLPSVQGKLHGDNLIVQIPNCQDREQVKAYTNLEIYIEREQLPSLANEEFYWIDLIGLTVINNEEIILGTVSALFATGSNDVLIVKDAEGKERYIPYLHHVVLKVDLAGKTLHVDWDATF